MADESSAELKKLIGNFRVSELQSLLSFAGRNKHGKKTELFKRAIEIVDSGCPQAIAFKIHQLSRLRQAVTSNKELVSSAKEPEQGTNTVSATTESTQVVCTSSTVTLSTAALGACVGPLPDSVPVFPTERSSTVQSTTVTKANSRHSASSFIRQLSETLSQSSDSTTVTPSLSRYSFAHPSSSASRYFPATAGAANSVSLHLSDNMAPLHPDVRMKPLPFYDLVDVLLKPSNLSAVATKAISLPDNYRRASFSFFLTPRQASQILGSQSDLLADDCGIVEYSIQIQLRFSLSETTSQQDDCFPANIAVYLNDREVQLPSLIPSNKVGVEPKRPSRPLNVTSLAVLSPLVPNNITVVWSVDSHHSHCVSAYLVHYLTSNELLNRLKLNGIRHQDHTRALIKEKLSHNTDAEISTTSLRISLLCPLSKQRIVIPCRPSSCSHLQCFDASTFLQMNEKKSTWTCPVCNKPAEYWNLIIDGLFTEILTMSNESSDIQFTASGQWSTVEPARTQSSVRTIDDSLVIQTIEDSPGSSSKKVDLIDLTETDDEEVHCDSVDDDDDDVLAVSPQSSTSISTDSTLTLEGFPLQLQQHKKARQLTWTSSSSSSSSSASPLTTPGQSTASYSDDVDVITLD
jgi:hypothetical protein